MQKLIINATVCFVLLTVVAPAFSDYYAVDDKSSRDSQLVFVTQSEFGDTIMDIGSTYKNLDIEGIDFDPKTGVLYAVGGDNGKANAQNLYTWDITTGELIDLGTIGGKDNPFNKKDLIGAAFRDDSSFWVSVKNMGLYTVDLSDLSATLQSSNSIFAKGSGADGIAWAPDASNMYVARGKDLYSWNPASPEVLTKLNAVKGSSFGDNIGGLGFVDGQLVASGGTAIYDVLFDEAGNYSATKKLDVRGRDFQSITGANSGSSVPEPATMALLALGGVMVFIRKGARKRKKV